MRTIPSSELIINDDGSIFHLHLKPEQLADIVILVGDPGRVAMVASFFDTQEYSVSNREFNTVTGTYKGKRMTVLSTGIGIGNIDISVTELDALATWISPRGRRRRRSGSSRWSVWVLRAPFSPTSKWGSSSSPALRSASTAC
mgnify:CR=1 FL=1